MLREAEASGVSAFRTGKFGRRKKLDYELYYSCKFELIRGFKFF